MITQCSPGNYGVPTTSRDEFGLLEHFESEKVHISGLVIAEYSTDPSHWFVMIMVEIVMTATMII